MAQEASGWKTLFTRANQLVRAATHPATSCPLKERCLRSTGRPGGSTRHP
jgi:hypothetical protein